MRGAVAAGVAKGHVVEFDVGRQRDGNGGGFRVSYLRLAVQQPVDALRCGQAVHALVQDGSQVAHGAVDLDAEHQDDQQSRQLHIAGSDAKGADTQRRGGAHGDGTVGNAAPQGIGRQYPHGRAEQVAGADGQGVGSGLALAERLEGGKPLDGIEQFGGKGAVSAAAFDGFAGVEMMPDRRGEQGDEREDQHHRGNDEIEPGDEGENQQRRQHRHGELRDVLAEVHLQLLHAVHQRQRHVAGTLLGDVAGAEIGDLGKQQAAQMQLHLGGGLVRHDGPPVLQRAAQHDDQPHGHQRQQQVAESVAREDAPDEPTEQRQPRDAERRRRQPDDHGVDDAQPQSLGEGPES